MPLTFLIRRAATAAITLLLASIMVFGALLAVPGDPVQLILGLNYDPNQYAVLSRQLGLDRPPLERYFSWLGGIFHGDLGTSTSLNAPVTKLIVDALPVTVPLVLASSVVALFIALPVGVTAATRRGTIYDGGLVALTQLSLAIPSFWVGLLLILLFAVTLRWLPATAAAAGTADVGRVVGGMVLPVVTLALGQAAGLVRMVRGGVLDVLGQDYVRTARSKGLREGVVVRKHVLRNALVSTLTLLGIQVGQLLAGAIIVESVFSMNGLGSLGLRAVRSSDFPLVQGVVFIIAAAIVIVNLVVDLLYGVLDPRIRYD